jgi:hypothetical protein
MNNMKIIKIGFFSKKEMKEKETVINCYLLMYI